MPLGSVEYSIRIVDCMSLGRLRKNKTFMITKRVRRVNDPFDPYGSLSALTLRRVQFTDRILHVIRET